jgi:hypothetical protein
MAYALHSETRIPCEIDGCDVDFARLADMQRHVREHHRSPLLCPQPGCDWRGARRKTRLENHLQKVHPEIHRGIYYPRVCFTEWTS